MNNDSHSTRDHAIDNLRFVLIFLVVFAHLLEICPPFVGSERIYRFIYSFHMPVFIFLFGYNVKNSLKRLVYRWCIPYAFFQCAYIIFINFVLNNNTDFQFTTPYWLLWYLLVCIYYQLLLPLFDIANKHKQIVALLCVFIFSLLVGYVNSIGYYMSLSRFFVFQPWFVLGYYCKKNNVLHHFFIHPQRRLFALIASTVIITLLTPIICTFPSKFLYGSYSYSSCGGTIGMRTLVSVMSFSIIIFLFVGIWPYWNKQIILITKIGKNTWPIFLLHGFVVKTILAYFPHLVNTPWHVILLSCIILLLTGNELCKKAVYFTCFSWLEKFHTK